MINIPSRLPQRLLTVVALSLAIAISGCQQQPDTKTADNTQNNNPAVNTTMAEPQTPESTQSNESTNSAEQQAPLTILALGDSLTEGLGVDNDANYPAQLEARLKEMGYKDVKVINSGLSGETSTGLVNRLDWGFTNQT